jgi:hypothetical protein
VLFRHSGMMHLTSSDVHGAYHFFISNAGSQN